MTAVLQYSVYLIYVCEQVLVAAKFSGVFFSPVFGGY